MKLTQHRIDTTTELIEAAEYAATILAKIPAFGNDIGKEVSKAQLGVAHNLLVTSLDHFHSVSE